MTSKTKRNRFNELHLVLQYCSDVTDGVFTPGERICINQERGQLLAYDNEMEFIKTPAPAFDYSPELANKIEFYIEKVSKTGYQPRPRMFSAYGL